MDLAAGSQGLGHARKFLAHLAFHPTILNDVVDLGQDRRPAGETLHRFLALGDVNDALEALRGRANLVPQFVVQPGPRHDQVVARVRVAPQGIGVNLDGALHIGPESPAFLDLHLARFAHHCRGAAAIEIGQVVVVQGVFVGIEVAGCFGEGFRTLLPLTVFPLTVVPLAVIALAVKAKDIVALAVVALAVAALHSMVAPGVIALAVVAVPVVPTQSIVRVVIRAIWIEEDLEPPFLDNSSRWGDTNGVLVS
jgi:hypothetical protein